MVNLFQGKTQFKVKVFVKKYSLASIFVSFVSNY